MSMKASIFGLVALCASLTLLAQETGLSQVSAEQRFRQWDIDGDGKLTRDEVPVPRLFTWLDKDGDGAITMQEAGAFGGPQQHRHRVGISGGAPLPPAEDFNPRPHGEEAKAAGLNPDVLAHIDIEMQRHIAAKNVAGVLAVIHHDGQRGYFEAFGWQDIEAQKPMSKDAIFRLQSMTKPLVAACALMLFDEGLFTLDEPISKHCPEWAQPVVRENGRDVPARNPITPRMLMSHSSGLYYGTLEGGPFTGGAVGGSAGTNLGEYSRSLAGKPLKFHPGEGYSYGTSIDILGRYIEAVSGLPLDEFLRSRILGPLKMVDTDFWVPQEKTARIAQLYSQPARGQLLRGRSSQQITTKPTLFLGGQGLCSTAADYERFCLMLMNRGELDGVRILKPETVDLMFQNHLKVPGRKYGLGGAVDGVGGYAWGGANGTQFWIDRKNNLFAIFMVQTQRYKAPTYPVFRALVNEAAGIPRNKGITARAQHQ